jgi:hypothetical protein
MHTSSFVSLNAETDVLAEEFLANEKPYAIYAAISGFVVWL